MKVIEKGVEIKELNIGSMAHSVGKVMVSTSLSMDQDDVETYKKLADFFTKLQNRQAGSEEDTDSSKNKDKKADKKNKDNSSKTKKSGKSA